MEANGAPAGQGVDCCTPQGSAISNKKKKKTGEVFTTDTPALEALLPLIGKPPRHGLVDL